MTGRENEGVAKPPRWSTVTRRWVTVTALMSVPAGLAAAVMTLAIRTGNTGSIWPLLPSTAVIAGVGGLLSGLRPRYAGGWLMLTTGVLFLVGQIAEQGASGLQRGEVPVGWAGPAVWVAGWIYPPALVPFFVFLPLTFPDGRLPSRRWRPLAVAAGALAVVLTLVRAFAMPTLSVSADADWPNPYVLGDFGAAAPTVNLGAQLGVLLASIAATGSLVGRWQRAHDNARRQILWVLLALGAVCVSFAADAVLALLAPALYPQLFPVIQLTPVVVPIAVAVAVLRHRLFDIDVLVSRTIVYGALTAALLLLYAAVVVAVGSVVPTSGDAAGRLVATALVAVVFVPARQWLQRTVGRRLVGARVEPYVALVQLSRKLDAPTMPDDVLTMLARSLAEALSAPYVLIEPVWDGTPLPSAEHGRPLGDHSRLVEVTLSHSGIPVGHLFVAQRRHEQFAATDLRLLSDLALPTAAALYALGLSRDLAHSRERLVRTIEDERRRLGRDLHDGLGPSLAAISMQAETAASLIHSDPDGAARLLSRLVDQTERAVGETRQLAYTHRPPTLDALGLVVALSSHITHLTSIPVELVVPDVLPQLPAAVEIAVYRIALEALNNVIAHADAHRCRLRITHDRTSLIVEVEDDGRGIPPHHRPGIGHDSMRERAEELGGTLTMSVGRAGRGTLVRAVLPCDDHAAPTDPETVSSTEEHVAQGTPWHT